MFPFNVLHFRVIKTLDEVQRGECYKQNVSHSKTLMKVKSAVVACLVYNAKNV